MSVKLSTNVKCNSKIYFTLKEKTLFRTLKITLMVEAAMNGKMNMKNI